MSDRELLETIVACRKGSVIAPAGCGKTEQIARAALHGQQRRLILTHTLAGVDALRARFRSKGAQTGVHEVNTIASWSLRLAAAFPKRSKLSITKPDGNEWDDVYTAAERLITAGHINSVITSSYCGIFVDEYQDCTLSQHKLICALACLLPCCIFGDHLQAIFGFRGNPMPDWQNEVLQEFPKVAELRHPHRWYRIGNGPLGDWLTKCRDDLISSGQIDLQKGPPTVRHRKLSPTTSNERYRDRIKLVLAALADGELGGCIVIGDSRNEGSRALLARSVRANSVEPVSCRQLNDFVSALDVNDGSARLDLVLNLVKAVMVKADTAALKKSVTKSLSNKRAKPLSKIKAACIEITRSRDLKPILGLLEMIPTEPHVRIYRRELHSALCAALRDVTVGLQPTLADAVWDIQNRRRHFGRRFGARSIGSTLLVKGLEFDHVIVVDVETLSRNDLYVALTRGSRTITVISESPILRPSNS